MLHKHGEKNVYSILYMHNVSQRLPLLLNNKKINYKRNELREVDLQYIKAQNEYMMYYSFMKLWPLHQRGVITQYAKYSPTCFSVNARRVRINVFAYTNTVTGGNNQTS